MISHNFHHTILRSYDIRGVVGITLFNTDAFSIGLTFGTITKNSIDSDSKIFALRTITKIAVYRNVLLPKLLITDMSY